MLLTCAIFFALSFVACNHQELIPPKPFDQMQFSEGNEPNDLRIKLGRMLFYDPILSRDSTVSCASCHIQSMAFTDGKKVGEGIEGRKVLRNSPTLGNVSYHSRIMRDGGVPTLEMQVLVPVQEHSEFDFNMVLLAERLANHKVYSKMALKAYNRPMDPYVITRAIAVFERTMVSNQSPFDEYFYQNITTALSAEQLEGYALFKKLGCENCHSGPDFTNYNYYNIGLYEYYPDSGRTRITNDTNDRGKIKTPTLRNVALTAPYMHDGSIQTVEEVISHFASGGKSHSQKSDLIVDFEISEKEKAEILSFLSSLTDKTFISDTTLSNPF